MQDASNMKCDDFGENITDDEDTVRGVIKKAAEIVQVDGCNITVLRNATRAKNRQFMDDNNYTVRDIGCILRRLHIWQYCYTSKLEGCPDAYCFGVKDHNVEIYVKFSFVGAGEAVAVTVISFHDPSYALTYPHIHLKLLECGKQ